MKLKVKPVGSSAGGPYIAIMNRRDADKLDLDPGDRINIRKGKKNLVAILNISDNVLKKGYIGFYVEIVKKLKVNSEDNVLVSVANRPVSLQFIKDKLDGRMLTKSEIDSIINDVINNNLSEVELTYFVSGAYINGMSIDEVHYLTDAIVKHGGVLKLNKKIIVDKHSIGGVPGNRTSMVVVPIVGAAGLTIPKTSTRSITSPAGTADTMEVFAPVDLNIKKIKSVVRKCNACLVWGGTMDLASADDKLIRVERPIRLDPEGILLSSIMAKKKSVGATHILIDIPVGEGAKVSKSRGIHLKKKFIQIAKKLDMKISVILTDGSQPIGDGVGPNLEARDVLAVLHGNGPIDLRKKSIMMADLIFKLVGVDKSAKEILDSGLAYKKMKEIIKLQGGNENIKISDIKVGKYRFDYKAKKSGIVVGINNKNLSRLVRIAGAPNDKGAGVYLYVRVGYRFKKGGIIFSLYASSKTKFDYAKNFLEGVTDFRF